MRIAARFLFGSQALLTTQSCVVQPSSSAPFEETFERVVKTVALGSDAIFEGTLNDRGPCTLVAAPVSQFVLADLRVVTADVAWEPESRPILDVPLILGTANHSELPFQGFVEATRFDFSLFEGDGATAETRIDCDDGSSYRSGFAISQTHSVQFHSPLWTREEAESYAPVAAEQWFNQALGDRDETAQEGPRGPSVFYFLPRQIASAQSP